MNKPNNNGDLLDSPVDSEPVPDISYINKEYLKELTNINNKDLKEEETTPYRKKSIKDGVREFIEYSDGTFTMDDILRELSLLPNKRNSVRCALSDFINDGIIERKGQRSGTYSPIRGTGKNMNEAIKSSSTTPVKFRLPLVIDSLLNIYNRNLIVVQGLSNAGKTAFLMEIARINKDLFSSIRYINTEMDASEIRDRIERRNIDLDDFLSFVSFYLVQSTHLSGAIRYEIDPNGLNLVDYLHLEDATLMATEMDKIQERLDNGIAVVAIQKYFGKDMGYGGHGVKNRARLVIDLSKDICTLKKVKSPKFWHKEIRLDDAYRKFEYDKDGSINPKSSWFTADDKEFKIYSNGLEWWKNPVPVPDDEFVREE